MLCTEPAQQLSRLIRQPMRMGNNSISLYCIVHTTTNAINSTATVVTRRSVNISCISYGIPVPTITWRFNNQPAIYTQTDIFTNYSVSFTGDIIDEITQGNVVSTLHVVDARTTGEYVCIGSNTHSGATTTSSAMITVQVLGQLTVLWLHAIIYFLCQKY